MAPAIANSELCESECFFAPVESDLVDSLLAQYRSARSRIEAVSLIATSDEYAHVMHYFLEGNVPPERRYGVRSPESVFASSGAIAALNSAYWSKTLAMTDVLNLMPQKRRDEWDKSITDHDTPEFAEKTVRDTLTNLLGMRPRFFAEKVDGVFRSLSGVHVTNSPTGFNRRMILRDEAVKAGTLAPWRTAAECIDFSIPCPSIFERKRPLAEATLRRIARGLRKFVIDNPDPFIVNVANSKTTGRAPNTWSADEPLRTVTAAPGFAVVEPKIAPFVSTYYGDKRPTDVRGVSMEMPIGTQTTENRHALVSATLVQTGYGERAGQEPRAPGLDKPLGTVVAGGAKHALVSAFLAKHYTGVVGSAMTQPIGTITSVDHHSKVAVHLTKFRSGSVGSAMDEPLHTLTAGGEPARPSTGNVMGLVTASLIHMGHGEASKSGAPRWSDGTRDIEQPLNTVTASGMPAAVVTSNLVKLRGDNIGSAADEPLHTISAQGQHHAEVRAFLLKYYGNERDGASCNDPMHTVRNKDSFGLVYIKGEAYEIADIGLRMLTPRELARAQGFPESYVLDCEIIRLGKGKTLLAKTTRLSKTAQVRMIGNSVCPEVAAAVVAANFTHEVEMALLEVA